MVAAAYLDASALVKLIVEERESPVLRTYLAKVTDWLTSRVAEVEVARTVRRRTDIPEPDLTALWSPVSFIELDSLIAALAASLLPAALRSLDAIHLATAITAGPSAAFVTYDDRLAAAARANGLKVESPGAA